MLVTSIDQIDLRRTLGDGTTSTVHYAIHVATKKPLAIKMVINKKDYGDATQKEARLLQELKHEHIVSCYGIFETMIAIYMVLEYCGDKDLYWVLDQLEDSRLDEDRAKRYCSQILSALVYLHGMLIAHRDIKPENILIDSNDNVKLVDFGFAERVGKEGGLTQSCGTEQFLAPEIIRVARPELGYNIKSFGLEVDMWALGISLYVMLTGYFPFEASSSSRDKLQKYIAKGHIELNYEQFLELSDHAKALIKRLLVCNPSDRLTASNALSDPWFAARVEAERPLKRARIDSETLEESVQTPKTPESETLSLPGEMATEIACRAHCAEDVRALAHVCKAWHTAIAVNYTARVWATLTVFHFPNRSSKETYFQRLKLLANRMVKIIDYFLDEHDNNLKNLRGKLEFEEEPRNRFTSPSFPLPSNRSDNSWWWDYSTIWDRGCDSRADNLIELCSRFLRSVSARGRMTIYRFDDASDGDVGYYMCWDIVHSPKKDCWIWSSHLSPDRSYSERDSMDEFS
jgi:serine/threonine protein kinase